VKKTRPARSKLERNGLRRYGTSVDPLSIPIASKTETVSPTVIAERRARRKRPSLDAITQRCARKLFERNRELKRLTDLGPVAGSIWTTHPEKEKDLFGPLVLVLETPQSNREALWVAEVTQEREKFEEGDIRVSRRTSGLHFGCIIRASMAFFIEPEKLLTCAGRLSHISDLLDSKLRGS
jgi:hypothetical protein